MHGANSAPASHNLLGLILLAFFALGAGCSALSDDLKRGEVAYEQARFEAAKVWLVGVERDTPDMDPEMRSRFYYLRGMTAYRLGQRADALHYLALCREVAGDQGGGLRPEWKETMQRTLAELAPPDEPESSASEESGAADEETP